MSTTADPTSDLLARLLELERRAGIEVTPSAAVDADGWPLPVVSGELIEAAWGNAVVMALNELRVGAIVAKGTTPAVNFASTAPVQVTFTHDVLARHTYRFHAINPWLATVGGTVVSFEMKANGVNLRTYRETNALSSQSISTETADLFTDFTPTADIPGCVFQVIGSRAAGTGTVQFTSGWHYRLEDMGELAAALPASVIEGEFVLDEPPIPEGGFASL